MPLSPGARLGPYEITGHLGAGGMGDVYRPHDARLNRDVAIKILPPAFAEDAEESKAGSARIHFLFHFDSMAKGVAQ